MKLNSGLGPKMEELSFLKKRGEKKELVPLKYRKGTYFVAAKTISDSLTVFRPE